MDQQQLLAETNELLKRVLEMDAAKQATQELARREAEEMMKQSPFAGPESDGSDEIKKWEQRLETSRQQSQQRMEEFRRMDAEYRSQLLQELSLQTSLLREIAEKLGKA